MKSFLFFSLFVLISIVALTLYGHVHTRNLVNTILNTKHIEKLELIGNIDTIVDSVILKNINSLLKQNKRINVETPRTHSYAANINIFSEDRALNMTIVKHDTQGWVLEIGTNWYKNDSFVRLISKYLPT